jgi:hypothetical protein
VEGCEWMRVIDTSKMRLVHRGADWPLEDDPSSKKMASHLVRNERLVTWLQPVGAGPEEQVRPSPVPVYAPALSSPPKLILAIASWQKVPAIHVGGKFCSLSVRMMKAIWRYGATTTLCVPARPSFVYTNKGRLPLTRTRTRTRARTRARRDVRLRRGFINLEPLPQGGFKLKIPAKLLQDKQRTQRRFKTMRQRDLERKTKERRGMSIMTKRVHSVLKARAAPSRSEAFPKSLPIFFFVFRKTRRFSSVYFSSRNQTGGKYQAQFEKF